MLFLYEFLNIFLILVVAITMSLVVRMEKLVEVVVVTVVRWRW